MCTVVLVKPSHVPTHVRTRCTSTYTGLTPFSPQDTRQLVVHQLRVQVQGWEEVAVPVSVDKIGLFFREIHPDHSHDHTLSKHPAFKVTRTYKVQWVLLTLGTSEYYDIIIRITCIL